MLLLLSALLAAPPADGLSPTDAAPHWVWVSDDAKPQQVARFRHTFQVRGRPKNATLSVAGDNGATVWINGQKVAASTDWGKPQRADATGAVRGGKNAIAVRGRNAGGAAAVLVQLDLTLADGKPARVVSGPHWRAADGKGDAADRVWTAREYPAADEWAKAADLGPLGTQPWGDVPFGTALPTPTATPADEISVPEGFAIELLYSVPKESQGSWVSMTTDPEGRLIVSDQYGKLYRVTPQSRDVATSRLAIEPIDLEIGMAHGLLCAHDALYVMVNDPGRSGFYRVTDTDGDDAYDDVELLKSLEGHGEHGPHAIRQGPDGRLWVIAGNHTAPPEDYVVADSPFRNFREDLLLPRNPDGNGHATGRMAPAGWIASCEPDGSDWRLYCGGFRNPYDIAWNTDGELFTYDADMEWDTGTPWYRPTRVNHVVSAGEYGWRYGTGKWPDYHVDSVGSVVDIGMGSPTGIEFGTDLNVPDKYKRALFLNDWTYGRIYAVHMTPRGASYTATFETFAEGKPFPVTDIVANPHDGALYVTTGGRRTQSGLYRITAAGETSGAGGLNPPAPDASSGTGLAARRLRRSLEARHTPDEADPAVIEAVWPHLGSPDRAIRYAARVAIERQPVASWADRLAAETRTNAVIQACCALARTGDQPDRELVMRKLNALPYARMSEEQILDALRCYQLVFIRIGGHPTDAELEKLGGILTSLVPNPSKPVNREVLDLMVWLHHPAAVDLGLDQLSEADTQQDQMFYAFVLRNLTGDVELWDEERYTALFGWLNLAEAEYRGGNSFKKFVAQIRKDAVAKLPEELKSEMAATIAAPPPADAAVATTRQFVHNWQLADFADELAAGMKPDGRDVARGREAFVVAQCAKCHRFDGEGGSTGPDLTGVGNRFDARYVLEAVIHPDAVISDQYRSDTVLTDAGEVFTGRVTNEGPDFLEIRTDPFGGATTRVDKSAVLERQPATVSEMPAGLVNVLTREEVLDLVAHMRSGGKPTADRP